MLSRVTQRAERDRSFGCSCGRYAKCKRKRKCTVTVCEVYHRVSIRCKRFFSTANKAKGTDAAFAAIWHKKAKARHVTFVTLRPKKQREGRRKTRHFRPQSFQ